MADGPQQHIADLREQIAAVEQQLARLKEELEQAEDGAGTRRSPTADGRERWPLSCEQYRRYGRQMVMAEVGLPGQLRLVQARVLVVGVGGLGCPAAAYLAAAGVGVLGLVDGDVVEVSNLHRQVAHSTPRVGMGKVESACRYLSEYGLSISVRVGLKNNGLMCSAVPIVAQYDIVLDCTDRPTSRYLVSDACVLAGRPLVSASALKTEGQLMVLNHPPRRPGDRAGGPCYRCIFPQPPPAGAVLSCGEGGILGPVVGVMGVLQALEAIKLLTREHTSRDADVPASTEADAALSRDADVTPPPSPRPILTIFSAYSTPQFRSVRMRSRRPDCACCSEQTTWTQEALASGSVDYAAFCGLKGPSTPLPPDFRISASDFARLPRDGSSTLIDVRDAVQFQMCALEGSRNVPWKGNAQAWLEKAFPSGAMPRQDGPSDYYIVCRFGNDSQLAVEAIRRLLQNSARHPNIRVKDIRGGFRSWREEVDREWPDY